MQPSPARPAAAPVPQPLDLPAPAPAAVRRDHKLFGLARALAWPGVHTRISLAPANPLETAPAAFDTWCEWRLGAWHGLWGCRQEDLTRLAPPELQPWLDAAAPAELAAFLRETALAPWLGALESQAGQPVRLSGWSATAPANLPEAVLIKAEVGDKVRLTTVLVADETVWAALAGVWGKIAPLVDGAEAPGPPLLVAVEAGRKTLPAAEWKSVGPGDVVILDCHAPGGEAPCRIRVGDRNWFSAKLNGKKIELLAPMATEAPPPASAAPGDAWADSLPVTVVFEAGRVELPLKELRALRPGYCFELAQAPGAVVALLANGQAIGEGELVRLGDTVGVRIVRLRVP